MDSLNVVLAVDSFKGSASSAHVEELIAKGIRRVCPDCSISSYPIADGGEGTVEAIISALDGRVIRATVQNPLGEKIEASYGLTADGTAIIEMAAASGITLIEQTPENALSASTWGVGDLIRDALNHGVRRILVGLGGSATSDGGVGMAKALGARFLDASGEPIPCGLIGLKTLASIDCSGLDPRIANTEFVLITDVTNPLNGPRGALYTYGPAEGHRALAARRARAVDGSVCELARRSGGARDLQSSGCRCRRWLGRGTRSVLPCAHRARHRVRARRNRPFRGGCGCRPRYYRRGAHGRAVCKRQSARGRRTPRERARCSRGRNRGEPCRGHLDGIYNEGIDLVIPLALEPMSLDACIARTEALVPIAGESAMRAFLLGREC